MCGRYVSRTGAAVERYFKLRQTSIEFASYNVTPGTHVPVVQAAGGERVLTLMHWGLIPHWAKDRKIGYKLINARAETAAEKPAFRAAFRARRCLLPADGFYEWQRDASPRQPYYIHRGDGTPLALAGLWEVWADRDARASLFSCSILTTAANADLAGIHHRMPVILKPEAFDTWLGGAPEETAPLLRPYEFPLQARPVSRYVNRPGNDGPACIEPITESAASRG